MSSRPQLTHRNTSTATKQLVLISGGNTGIGYEIVKMLAVEHSDTHHVLMGCRDTSKGEAAVASMGAPINVNPIQLDVTSDESIELCFKTIEQTFGRLDVLINNAGTAGMDLPKGTGLREVYTHVYSVNVTGAACLTEKMTPLLEKSSLPKIIFVSSTLGSVGRLSNPHTPLIPVPFYNSSKAAMNYLAAYYARLHPTWKINACSPGLRATGLNETELNENTHPKLGATVEVNFVLAGKDSPTGTFVDYDGSPVEW